VGSEEIYHQDKKKQDNQKNVEDPSNKNYPFAVRKSNGIIFTVKKNKN
jgi:hypothetical protein